MQPTFIFRSAPSSGPARSGPRRPRDYRARLREAGFAVTGERDWTGFVLPIAEAMRARIESEGIPVVGLHLLMAAAPASGSAAVRDGLLAPIEIDAVAA